jgi:tetratricopeptide (TPR) repeat protein
MSYFNIANTVIIKGTNMNKFIASLMVCLLANAAFAVSPNNKFTLDQHSALNVKLLDNAWKNRETLANQQIIADYLMTFPVVPNHYEIAWKTARMVYFIGNYGIGEKAFVDTEDGIKLFEYGYKAGKIAVDLKPKEADGQFWYAIDMGSYGLAYGVFAAASHARDGMHALEQVMISTKPDYQWYGSYRILGKYYEELPGIFGGSNKKALALITAATTKAPQFSNNWVFLGQFYNKTGEYNKALDACKQAVAQKPQDGKFEEKRYIREANECIALAQKKLAD